MPSRTSRNGQPAPLGRLAEVLERRVLDRPGQGHHTLGPVGPGRRVDPLARHVLDLDPALGRQGLDVVQDLGGVHALGHQQRRSPDGGRRSAARGRPGGPRPGRRPARRASGHGGPGPPRAARSAPAVVDRCPAGAPAPAPHPCRPRPPEASLAFIHAALASLPVGSAAPRAPPFGAGVRDRLPRPPGWCRTHRTSPSPGVAPGLVGAGGRPGGQQHHGGAGDPLGPAQGPQALGPGGLDVDRRTQGRDRAARPCGDVRREPGALGDHGAVGVDRHPAGRGGQAHHPVEEFDRVGPGPPRVGVRAVPAEVAEARRAPRTASATAWATASASQWPASPRTPSPAITTPPSTRGRPGSSLKGWTSMPWPTRSAGTAVDQGAPASSASARARSSGRGQLEVAGVAGDGADRQRRRPPAARRRRWRRRRRRGRRAARRRRRPAGSGRPPARPGRRWPPPGRPAPASTCRQRARPGRRRRRRPPGRRPPRRRTGRAGRGDGRRRARPPPSASAGTTASPARTESARVAPPATTTSAPKAASPRAPGAGSGSVTPAGSPSGHHQDHTVGRRAGGAHRPGGDRVSGQGEELLAAAEPATRAAGHHDGPDGPRSAQGSASLRRTSAVSSSTPRANVSSDTRIWRARLSMRFSPADRPLSLSRMERFRTTSATW